VKEAQTYVTRVKAAIESQAREADQPQATELPQSAELAAPEID
jgi:hypothetical protein